MGVEKKKLSQLLDILIEGHQEQKRLSIGEMIHFFGVRAYGPLLFVFALPNAIPSIPGLLAILGAPLVFLSVQMMLGRVPWVPDIVSRQSIDLRSLISVRNKVKPWLLRMDKIVHPRLLWMTSSWRERVLGGIVFLLSLSVFTPVPFTNMIPALSICFVSIGVLERDGLWLIFGFLLGILGATITVSVLMAIFSAIFSL